MRREWWCAVLLALGLAAVVRARGAATGDASESPGVVVSAAKSGDTAAVSREGERVRVTVRSRSGIGRATLRRTGDAWPKSLVLRLHLRGLESLTIANGKTTLSVSVLSHSGHRRLLSLKSATAEEKVADGSPYHTSVEAYEADGTTTKGLPGAGGYFELVLPAALWKDNPAELKIAWIDFYR